MELLHVTEESYPVLYKMYWSDDLDDNKRIELNRNHNTILSTVYSTYYNLTLDIGTLDLITYTERLSPWQVIFKIAYKSKDGLYDYLWEYYENWVKILNLNRY